MFSADFAGKNQITKSRKRLQVPRTARNLKLLRDDVMRINMSQHGRNGVNQ